MTSIVSGSLSRCTCFCAAALFVAVSAFQNILHGYTIGAARSEMAALIFAGGSLAGALMQPCAFLAAFHAFRNWSFGKGIVALALGLACFCYATVSSLGFVATARDSAAATRAADVTAYETAKARSEAALAELKALAALPPAKRKIEAERAKRRAELEGAIAGATATLQRPHTASVADPTAAALAAYAGALGVAVRADALSPWLSLIAVLFFELGAASSFIVLSALPVLRRLHQNEHEIASEAERTGVAAAAEAEQPAEIAANEAPGKTRGRKRSTPLERVVDRIAVEGGKIEGPLDDIAAKLGLSRSGAHRALNALAGAGLATLATNAAGTLVELR